MQLRVLIVDGSVQCATASNGSVDQDTKNAFSALGHLPQRGNKFRAFPNADYRRSSKRSKRRR